MSAWECCYWFLKISELPINEDLEMKKILIPLPSYGFDPTEAAIPWKILKQKGMQIFFATPKGKKANCDQLMLKGEKLGIWKKILMARVDAVQAYMAMEQDSAFCNPLSFSELKDNDFDVLVLPGGHDKGVREYLESGLLQDLVSKYFVEKKPIAAICHGVVLVARSVFPGTRESVIHDYKTTALLSSQELGAYQLTRLWLKDYYLTYPQMSVEKEVRSVLSSKENFVPGPMPFLRDDPVHLSRGFTVMDRNYLSARWPGDAYSFSMELTKMIEAG
jgi:protease I